MACRKDEANALARLIIRVHFPHIRDKCACLGVEALEEFPSLVEERLGNEARVRHDLDAVLGDAHSIHADPPRSRRDRLVL